MSEAEGDESGESGGKAGFFSKMLGHVKGAGRRISASSAAVTGLAAGAGMSVGGAVINGGKTAFLALNGQMVWLLALLAFIFNYYHVVVLHGQFNVGVLFAYFLLAFLAAYFFYADKSDLFPLNRLMKFLGLTIAAYFWPWGLQKLAEIWPAYQSAFEALMVFAPLWIIYIAFNPDHGWITRGISILFLFGWTWLIVSSLVLPNVDQAALNGPGIVVSAGEARDMLLNAIRNFLTSAKEVPVQAFNETKNFFTGQVNYATQEYYMGTVDQSQGAPIGVFISDSVPLYQRFRNGSDDIIVTASLKARTFSKNLTVANRCYLQLLDPTKVSDKIYYNSYGWVQPDTVTIDYTGEFQDKFALDCTIPAKSTTVTSNGRSITLSDYSSHVTSPRVTSATVFLNSTFNFETWGYAEYAFMDRQLIQAFRLENKDPAEALMVHRMLTPKYTPGPLMLGMPSDTLPVPYTVGDNDQNLPAFGITLSNQWAGKGSVDEFRSVEFYIPKPFTIDADRCTPRKGTEMIQRKSASDEAKPLDYSGPTDWTENKAYNKYVVRNVAIRPGEMFVTLRCPLVVEKETTQYPVLGTAGAGKFTFFVRAEYIYSTWTQVPVLIQGDSTQ